MVDKQPNLQIFTKKTSEDKKVWRPRKFETAEELRDTFIAYCQLWVKLKRPITKTGFKAYILVYHWYFGELPEEFSETVSKINLVCKAYAEEELFVGKNVSGVIFNLTNNYPDERKNKQSNEHTGKDGEPLVKEIVVNIKRNDDSNAG